jgi:TRAP-type C4-dicarboxylate transport system substrate-binding protein
MPSRLAAVATLLLSMTISGTASAQSMKLSHNYPETGDNFRHQIALRFVEELKTAGIETTVFGNQRLLNTRAQWQGMANGSVDFVVGNILDMVAIPEFDVVNLPGALVEPKAARTFMTSKAAALLDEETAIRGVRVIGWFPMATAMGSTGACVETPQQMRGLSVRSSGIFASIVEENAGISANVPVPELAKAIDGGALDVINSTNYVLSGPTLKGRLKCVVTPTSDGAMGYLLTSIMMSAKTFEALPAQTFEALPAQKRTFVLNAARKAAAWGFEEADSENRRFLENLRADGVRIVDVSPSTAMAWRTAAEKKALPQYRAISPRKAAILDDLLALK